MRSLPLLVPDGCALTPGQLAEQAARAQRLRPAVADVQVRDDELGIVFGDGVDRALVDELVATEQSCCTFLTVAYDDAARTLRIGSSDEQGREVVRRLAGFFGAGR
jgi:hypothetical protein